MLNGSIKVSQMAKIRKAIGTTGRPATHQLSIPHGSPGKEMRPCRLL